MTELMPVNDQPPPKVPTLPDAQTVTAVKHWTDTVFLPRDAPCAYAFPLGRICDDRPDGRSASRNRQQKPLLRAYSIASPAWDEELEFYSIKVQDGPLTSKLQHIKVGDEIILRPKPVGTLVHDALMPGKRIWFFATGTGFAPFASLAARTADLRGLRRGHHHPHLPRCRRAGIRRQLIENLQTDELMQELIGPENLAKIRYYPTTTREDSPKMGRITTLLQDGTVFKDLGIDGMSAGHRPRDGCGSMGLNTDIKEILEGFGLDEGAQLPIPSTTWSKKPSSADSCNAGRGRHRLWSPKRLLAPPLVRLCGASGGRALHSPRSH